mgnify:CR=1 FL=1
MIKAVIFDLDNTLYNFDEGSRIGAEAFADYCVRELGLDREDAVSGWKEALDEQWKRMTDDCPAVHNRVIRAQYFLSKRAISEFPHAPRLAEAYWKGLMDTMLPEKGLIELLTALKSRKVKIAVGTNMTSYVQFLKIEKLGLENYIDCMISSEEAMAEKPTGEFFNYVMKKLGVKSEEAIFIGDSIKHDIEGAKGVGMRYAWYTAYASERDFARADSEGIVSRIASYADCLLHDGRICLGNVEL